MIHTRFAVDGTGLGAVLATVSLASKGCQMVGPKLAVPVEGGPVLVLNEKTLWMIGDLFGAVVLRDICRDGIEITHRKLRWGGDRVEDQIEKSLSVDAARLAKRFATTVDYVQAAPALTIRARGRRANTGVAFRPMTAFVWDLPQLAGTSMDWCATISARGTWAALAPVPSGCMNLQVYIAPGDEMEARTVGAEVLECLGMHADTVLATAPRRIDASAKFGSLWEEDGCAVGDEAFALDPLAGDGVGHTIRAALWVAALLSAEELSDGMRRELYRRRMVAAFQQHCEACGRYYRMLN